MDHRKNDGDAYPHGFGFPYQQHPPPRHLFPSNSFSGGGSVAIPPTFQHINHSGSFRHPPLPGPCPPYHIPHFVPFDPNPPSFHHHHHQIHHHHHHSVVFPSHSISFSDYEASSQHSRHASLATSSPIEVLPDGRLQDMVVYGHPVTSLHGSFSSPHFATLPSPSAGSHHLHGASFDGQPMVPFAGRKGQASLKVLLLHGSLDVWVCEARFLPNMEQFSKTLGDMLGPRLTSTLSGKMRQLPSITSDPYVTIMVSGATIGRTYVLSNTENPVWMQHFNLPVAHHAAEVQFLVKHNDIVGAQLIGTVSIPAEWIYSGERLEGFYPILDSNGKQCKGGAVLKLSIQYFPVAKLTMYHHGISAGPADCGVPGTYFPLRKGGNVTLYQDAHVSDGCLPELKLENGMNYVHGKCWRDIYDAISQARRLIYIIGWSVFHAVRLVRDTDHDSCPTLGDLLKSKSQEGVRVLLLVWDDPTSRSILGIRTSGVMGTHDEETRHFFKHSSVQVLLCPRSAGKRHSFAKQKETGTIYTHHQKQVIVDTDAGKSKRKITAFLGGLDLCGGRYDNQEHPLFRTLQSLHKDDYYNPAFASSDNKGPRQPWHDLYARIEGPAAYDVLMNFEERWLKAAKRNGVKRLKKSDDSLLKIQRIPDIIGLSDLMYLNDNDPETWHVQVFRSIDSNSAKGFPKDPREATHKNLICGKNVLIDMSIHTAYLNAIRSAQHFIYIENQYFLGSSFNWDSNNDLGANNLIPIEIALKIANKIKANEQFSAYIVIPMWPEGNPNSAPIQRILYWQKKTMQMMYEIIYTALKEAGLHDTYQPQDYLNFFCLGNREAPDLANDNQNASINSPQGRAKKNMRFMIYVHSKGMIVDDEYVILGSANINQRSLEGTRDTEIAVGAYQPQYTWARKMSGPRGMIYGYRMSLWAEHIGFVEECFTRPESLECMRRVNYLAQQNWEQYVSDEITEMRGHLLKYPVHVDSKGKVKPLHGCETFPDVGGNICGSFCAIQENLTI
ncbi:phospholipase D gamma 1-like [Zingiber officinale]|uniref:phospholipase D n=1 Tax=Zingiber officinale TaxID=94328 RepID=A0A8J5G6W5_ZINOF|nr:phospholipase D gamma 1-like [Zingiber officinale]KAG6497518.1 hypothetical protein ZIOFF_045419 [Zingiber officinale]